MGFPNNKITNGLSGGQYISAGLSASGEWIAIQVLADTKFSVLAGNVSDVANLTEGSAPTIPAGTTLFGKFTFMTLHSGRVIAYNA
jgi:hypothetical protein